MDQQHLSTDSMATPGAQTTSQPDNQEAADKANYVRWAQALSHGKWPSNEQMVRVLNGLMSSALLDQRRPLLSDDARLLIDDWQGFIGSIKNLILVKNKDQLMQSLFYHLLGATKTMSQTEFDTGSSSLPGQDDIKEEALVGGRALLVVLRLLVFSSSFRGLLADAFDVVQDILSNVAEQDESSDLSFTRAEVGHTTHDNPVQRNSESPGYEKRDEDDEDEEDDEHDEHNESNDHGERGQQHQGDQDQDEDQDQVHDQDHLRVPGIKEKATAAVQAAWTTKRQQEALDRLRHLLTTVQCHPDYKKAMDTLVSMVELWVQRIYVAAQESQARLSTNVSEASVDWSGIGQEAKAVLEDWAQGESIDPLINSVQSIVNDVQQDEELRKNYHNIKAYLVRLFKEPGYASGEESKQDGKTLLEQTKKMMNQRYQSHWLQFLEFAKAWGRHVLQDTGVQNATHYAECLLQDLWLDSQGHVTLKPQLVADLQMTLLPIILNQIKVIPIPRIEYSTPAVDIVVENLVISGLALVPNLLEVKADTHIHIHPKSGIMPSSDLSSHTSFNEQSLFVKMSETQAIMDHVVFCYQKHTFPRLSDRGLISLQTTGKGITIWFELVSSTAYPQTVYMVKSCKCQVGELRYKMEHCKHGFLYKILQPVINGVVRRQIAKTIEAKLTELLNKGDERLMTYLKDVQKSHQGSDSSTVVTGSQRPGLFTGIMTALGRKVGPTKSTNSTKPAKLAKRRRRDSPSSANPTSGSLWVESHVDHPQVELPKQPEPDMVEV